MKKPENSFRDQFFPSALWKGAALGQARKQAVFCPVIHLPDAIGVLDDAVL